MIRRAFVRAMSCAILTSLLGVKAWRLEASEDAFGIGGFDSEASGLIDPGPHEMRATIVYETLSIDGYTVQRHTHELRLPPPGPMQFEDLDSVGIFARRSEP